MMTATPATEPVEKPFYDAVSDLAKTVELAVCDLRLSIHPAGFRFSDLEGIGRYRDMAAVEAVAEQYLKETHADVCVFRRPNDSRKSTAIAENTSTAPFMVTAWEKYYGKKAVADHWIKNMQANMDEEVGFAVDMITRSEQLAERNGAAELRDNIARRVGNDFFGVVNGVWREVYDALNVKENPELLYALAFTAETEKRGYDKKTGDELEVVLRSQKIPVHEFEHYTGRNLAGEQEEKIRAAQPAPAPAVQTVQPRSRPARPATGGIADDDIGAAVDAAERGETVQQTTQTTSRLEYTEPYTLRDVRCVGSDGRVFEQYAELRVQSDVVREQNNTHRRFTPYQAITYFEGQQQFLPSMALSCNVLVALFKAAVRKEDDGTYTTLDAHANQILDQYKDYGPGYGWQAQNTVVDWKGKEIIHYPHDDDFPEHGGTANINNTRQRNQKSFNKKGFGDCTLEQACQNQNMHTFLQDFTGLENPAELGDIATYFGKTARVWISTEKQTRAAWLGYYISSDNFGLDANNYLSYSSAARGVAS